MFESVEQAQVEDHQVLVSVLLGVSHEGAAAASLEESAALVVATERVRSWGAGLQVAAIDAHAARHEEQVLKHQQACRARGRYVPAISPGFAAAASLAPLLHVAPRTMATRLHRARVLYNQLTTTFDLLLGGDLEDYRAKVVVIEAEGLGLAETERVEEVLHGKDITDTTGSALRRRARRVADQCAALPAERLAKRVARARCVTVRPGPVTGTTTLTACLASVEAHHVFSAVDALAHEYARASSAAARHDTAGSETAAGSEDGPVAGAGGMDAARADAFVDLLAGNATISTTIELLAPINGVPSAIAPRFLRSTAPSARHQHRTDHTDTSDT